MIEALDEARRRRGAAGFVDIQGVIGEESKAWILLGVITLVKRWTPGLFLRIFKTRGQFKFNGFIEH